MGPGQGDRCAARSGRAWPSTSSAGLRPFHLLGLDMALDFKGSSGLRQRRTPSLFRKVSSVSKFRDGRPWSVLLVLGVGAICLGLFARALGSVDPQAFDLPATKYGVAMLAYGGGALAIFSALAWFAVIGKRHDEA